MSRRKSNRRWRERGWKTYAEARQAFRDLLEHHLLPGRQPGDPLPADANEYLLWLAKGHPHAEQMLEHGLQHFTFRLNGRTPTLARGGYELVLVDKRGRKHPFSTSEALKGTLRSARANLNLAMQHEVRDQLQEVCLSAQHTLCPETHEKLDATNTEVDYVGQLLPTLVSMFLHQELKLTIGAEEGLAREGLGLLERDTAARWREFHREHARLEAVSTKGLTIRTERRRNQPFRDLRS